MLRIALITNHPPPFRIPIYKKIGSMAGVDLHTIFCSAREPNRQWELPSLEFNHVFLKEHFVTRGSNFIHNNPDVISVLQRLSPDVIVTTGFNPTFLYAFAYALAKGIPHVPMTDGTDLSEMELSWWHKAIRRMVYARSAAFIAASGGGQRLYEGYGIAPARCFQSCLCIHNDAFAPPPAAPPARHDFVFSGRIEAVKNPLFALAVARATALRLGRPVSILFLGAGREEAAVRAAAAGLAGPVQAHFHGFAAQRELPALYRAARLFLFPTLWDPWGVVANEACAAGLPVLVSPHAGVAGELVRDGDNGFVCALDAELWAERAAQLLARPALWEQYSRRSLARVRDYTFERAAGGLVDACRFAAGQRNPYEPRTAERKVG